MLKTDLRRARLHYLGKAANKRLQSLAYSAQHKQFCAGQLQFVIASLYLRRLHLFIKTDGMKAVDSFFWLKTPIDA